MRYHKIKEDFVNYIKDSYNSLMQDDRLGSKLRKGAALSLIGTLGYIGCAKKEQMIGPEPYVPKEKAKISSLDIITYDADNDSTKNDVKFKVVPEKKGWIFYFVKALDDSIVRQDSAKVAKDDTATYSEKDLPFGDYFGEVKGENSMGEFFTIGEDMDLSENQGKVIEEDSVDTIRDDYQEGEGEKPDNDSTDVTDPNGNGLDNNSEKDDAIRDDDQDINGGGKKDDF